MYVLDTDILVDLYRRFRPTEEVVADLEERGRLALTPVTVHELVQGAFNKTAGHDAPEKVRRLVSAFEVLAYDEAASWIAGRLAAELQQAGRPIGDLDTMIAACTIAHKGTLVTRNIKHFQRVRGLEIHPLG